MSDVTVTIAYSITAITNNGDSTSTVSYTLSHSGTGLSVTRNDKFFTAALDAGVNTSTDSSPTKVTTLTNNFLQLAAVYFQNFANQVKAAQAVTDISNLDGASGIVSNFSVTELMPIHGTVTL